MDSIASCTKQDLNPNWLVYLWTFLCFHDFVSFITQRLSFSPFPSVSRLGHMTTPYIPDPKKILKFEKCLSYKGCDKMIEKG